MGWYVRCYICGREGARKLECKCYEKQADILIKRMQGKTIIDTIIARGMHDYVYYHLVDANGKNMFIAMCIRDDEGNEYAIWEKVWKISEEVFAEVKQQFGNDKHNNIKCDEDYKPKFIYPDGYDCLVDYEPEYTDPNEQNNLDNVADQIDF